MTVINSKSAGCVVIESVGDFCEHRDASDELVGAIIVAVDGEIVEKCLNKEKLIEFSRYMDSRDRPTVIHYRRKGKQTIYSNPGELQESHCK